MFKKAGIKVAEYGAIDTPGWPDPSGPRDVRLHRRYGTRINEALNRKPEWERAYSGLCKDRKVSGMDEIPWQMGYGF